MGRKEITDHDGQWCPLPAFFIISFCANYGEITACVASVIGTLFEERWQYLLLVFALTINKLDPLVQKVDVHS